MSLQSEGLPAVVAVGLSLPLGDEERFDWTPPDRRRRSLSPDVVPNLFRPRKESLVDVAFDHDRAASGLYVYILFLYTYLILAVSCHFNHNTFFSLLPNLW